MAHGRPAVDPHSHSASLHRLRGRRDGNLPDMVRASSLVVVLAGFACFSDAPPLSDDTGSTSATGEDTSMSGADDALPTTESGVTVDPTMTSADATTEPIDTSSSDTAPQDCGDDTCALVPAGWSGPFAVAFVERGDDEPACPDAYASEHPVPMHVGLPVFDCGCNCNELAPVAPCTAEFRKYEGTAECENEPSSTGANTMPGSCFPDSSDLVTSVAYVATSGPMEVPACSMGAPTPPAEQSYWELDAVLCGLDVSVPCESGVCAPPRDDPFGRLCILAEGEVECPEGYGESQLLFTDAEDDRECVGCSCTEEIGDCTPIIYRSADGNCTDLDAGVAACADVTGATMATTWQPTLAPGCYPTQMLSGTVSGQGPHTLCCYP
jgi:hypothetical protein